MLRETLIEWLHRGRSVVGERPATSDDLSSWVGIFPLDPSRPESRYLLRRDGVG